MEKLPIIPTKRLILGPLSIADIPRIVEYADNPNIAKMLRNLPSPYAEKDAVFWINLANQGIENKTAYVFKIGLKERNEFIGGMGLHSVSTHDKAEAGYWIAEPFWGKGYATEALGALLGFGFKTVGLNKIYAVHNTQNPASGKVMINNNMIKEGVLVDEEKKDDKYLTMVRYRLTKREYEELAEKK